MTTNAKGGASSSTHRLTQGIAPDRLSFHDVLAGHHPKDHGAVLV